MHGLAATAGDGSRRTSTVGEPTGLLFGNTFRVDAASTLTLQSQFHSLTIVTQSKLKLASLVLASNLCNCFLLFAIDLIRLHPQTH